MNWNLEAYSKFKIEKLFPYSFLVPILPDYLSQIDRESFDSLQESLKYKNLYLHYVSTMFGKTTPVENATIPDNFRFDVVRDKLWNDNNLNDENGAVGILLATKALIQLVSTPIVKSMSNSFGYRIPTVVGTFVLFLASLSMYHTPCVWNPITLSKY